MTLDGRVLSVLASAHPLLAADAVGTWLLWGGLAAFFTVLYIGVYIWMRRPKFGEGTPTERPGADGASHGAPAPPPTQGAQGPEPQEGVDRPAPHEGPDRQA